MQLKKFFATLSDKHRALQLGNANTNPLTSAFPHKRVVHAGLNGSMVSPAQSSVIWQTLLEKPPERLTEQAAYIHIPFCKTKCLYCGFFQNGSKQDVEDAYIDRLISEMEHDADSPRLKNSIISTVFIGGGTPTSLSPANVKRLLATIKKCLPLTNDYELTLEGRIHDLIPAKMDVWMAGGVNRISLGVQSFNTKVRQQLGRLDDEATIINRLQALHDYHQCAVIVDLIYGLPDQDMTIWEHDLELFCNSAIDGADLYQLNVFEGSALNSAIKNGSISKAATTAKQAEMFAFAHDYLTKRALKRLSACHWAKNSRERSLYNIMAKSGAAMFHYGCGAGGFIDGYAAMNHRQLTAYNNAIDAGKKPLMMLMKENPLQKIAQLVLAQLEQGFLNIKTLVNYNPKLAELEWLYQTWEKRQLVHFNGYLYELTVPGQFWQVNIAQSTIECCQILLTGQNSLAVERIAAQEH